VLPDTVADVPARLGIRSVRYVGLCDDRHSTRLAASQAELGGEACAMDDPHFLMTSSVIREFTAGREHL
jgi:hypothetical protein